MRVLMRLTRNSLATLIAWVSTCLLAGGIGTLLNESARTMWMIWGCFGLIAAIGLDIAVRAREWTRMDELELIATSRFERDIYYENEENEANSAIRKKVALLLGRLPPAPAHQEVALRRNKERYPCELDVELLLHQGIHGAGSNQGVYRCNARITSLSESGFELKHSAPLPHQHMKMTIWAATGDEHTMLGELLWCSPQPDGSFLAGGRFLSVIAVEGK
jgi:hypothetical protein